MKIDHLNPPGEASETEIDMMKRSALDTIASEMNQILKEMSEEKATQDHILKLQNVTILKYFIENDFDDKNQLDRALKISEDI